MAIVVWLGVREHSTALTRHIRASLLFGLRGGRVHEGPRRRPCPLGTMAGPPEHGLAEASDDDTEASRRLEMVAVGSGGARRSVPPGRVRRASHDHATAGRPPTGRRIPGWFLTRVLAIVCGWANGDHSKRG